MSGPPALLEPDELHVTVERRPHGGSPISRLEFTVDAVAEVEDRLVLLDEDGEGRLLLTVDELAALVQGKGDA